MGSSSEAVTYTCMKSRVESVCRPCFRRLQAPGSSAMAPWHGAMAPYCKSSSHCYMHRAVAVRMLLLLLLLLLLLIADVVLCIASQRLVVSQGRLLSPPLEFQRARLKNDRTENDEAIESTHNEWRHEVPAEGQASRLLALWYGGHLRPCRDRVRRSIVLH